MSMQERIMSQSKDLTQDRIRFAQSSHRMILAVEDDDTVISGVLPRSPDPTDSNGWWTKCGHFRSQSLG